MTAPSTHAPLPVGGGGGGGDGGELRGIFGPSHDSPTWVSATSSFPNGVPRFPSKALAESFMIDYVSKNPSSNPFDGTLMHIFTMLTDWGQIEALLLPAIERVRGMASIEGADREGADRSSADRNNADRNNAFTHPLAAAVLAGVKYRLSQPIHSFTNPVSTRNTLHYLFHHMKCGIFCMIKNGELQIFSSFVNKDYSNTWGGVIKLEGDDDLNTYQTNKDGNGREENVTADRNKWWANGNIICNELVQPGAVTQHWGDQFLSPLQDMLREACRTRAIPDVEFFINKRDYPQIKINTERGVHVEPYGFIYGKDDCNPEEDVDLPPGRRYETLAPVMSFYAASQDRFSDIPWPSSEDWEGACGEVFCNTFIHRKDDMGAPVFDSKPRDLFTEDNFQKFKCEWSDKVDTAFFRGTATGGGVTIEDNQRLMVSHLSHEWKHDQLKGGDVPYLDAAIVGWNMRDKKTHDKPMTFLRKDTLAFDGGKQFFTPIYKQSRYKYLVYVDGHCAACRYGFMMRLGSVIIKVESRQVADTMWYFPLLKPWVDYVPVKPDLSDMEEQIAWCRANDDKCKIIASNALKFYEKYVAKEGLLDYVEVVLKEVASRFVKAPEWWAPENTNADAPCLRAPSSKCFKRYKDDVADGEDDEVYCVRCQGIADAEERLKDEQRREREEKMKNQMGNKERMRERMREKAATEKKRKAEAAAAAAAEAEKKKQMKPAP
jgi:hypothetical protein